MEAGQLLYALLSTAPDVQAVVGTGIYPVVAPETRARPYVCYQLVSLVPEAGSSAHCRLGDVARVQLSLYADTYATLAQLTAAIRGVLDYQEPEPGVLLELDNQQDHHDPDALCLYRTLDYAVTLP